MPDYVKPHWVRLFPSDFLGGCTLMRGKHRTIYAYLLILQADMGSISLGPSELAAHMEVEESDVISVLDSKFDFNPDINAYINPKMEDEVMRAGGILARKTEGAAKARAKKEERESRTEQNRTDSDIKVDIKVDIKEPSAEGFQFADWFETLLPSSIQSPTAPTKTKWAEDYDRLIRLDGRNDCQIREVCEWARNDEFWGSNFLSPLKLRKKNGDGVKYFDVFESKRSALSRPSIPSHRQAKASREYEEPENPLPILNK